MISSYRSLILSTLTFVACACSARRGLVSDATRIESVDATTASADTSPQDVSLLSDAGAGATCPQGMAFVPAGPFLYGLRNARTSIDYDYCIDRTEVTARAFKSCIEAGGCEDYSMWAQCKTNDPSATPTQCRNDRDDYPATWVDWYRAEAFCRWAGKRLPSEREWEKAARSDDGRTFPWGEGPSCSHAHYERGSVYNSCLDEDGRPNHPTTVGSYPEGASPFGVLDLAGNVREWVEYRDDTSAPPSKELPGISRGGAYNEGEDQIATFAVYNLIGPGITSEGQGFRCAAAVNGWP